MAAGALRLQRRQRAGCAGALQRHDLGGADGRFAGVETWKHIGKAWTGLKLKRGTEIAAGLMVAPTHFGSFWTKDNWHSSITWGYSSVPFFLTGARVYQPIGDKVGIGLWLVNGYGTMGDGNKAPSGLLNLVILPSANWAIVNNLYVGPEDVELKPAAWRVLIDSQVVYNTERWGLAFVGDYFPRTRQRLGDGMDRVQKVNLLLDQEGAEAVVAKLRVAEPEALAKYEHSHGPICEIGRASCRERVSSPV